MIRTIIIRFFFFLIGLFSVCRRKLELLAGELAGVETLEGGEVKGREKTRSQQELEALQHEVRALRSELEKLRKPAAKKATRPAAKKSVHSVKTSKAKTAKAGGR